MYMTRLTLALAIWISFVSGLSASLAPRKERPLEPGKNFPRLPRLVSRAPAPQLAAPAPEHVGPDALPSEFVLTKRTEILLNGKPCRYEEIPDDARIVGMKVAEDRKTVLSIHFRTGK